MNVLLDANVFLSYLLAPSPHSTIPLVVDTCFTAEINILVPPELIAEIAEKAATKRYFRERIPQQEIDQFVQQLTSVGTPLPPLAKRVTYSRDPKDDYLIAYGIVYDADYLVTGDADLLILQASELLKIVTPADFLAILRKERFL
jgi:uncharacterized protein